MSMPLQDQMIQGQLQGQRPLPMAGQWQGQMQGQMQGMVRGMMSMSPPYGSPIHHQGVTTNAPGAWKGNQEIAAMEELPPWGYGMQRFGPVSLGRRVAIDQCSYGLVCAATV
jgi:hypothetical protein